MATYIENEEETEPIEEIEQPDETEENKEIINNTETIKETKEAATATAEKSPKTGNGIFSLPVLILYNKIPNK